MLRRTVLALLAAALVAAGLSALAPTAAAAVTTTAHTPSTSTPAASNAAVTWTVENSWPGGLQATVTVTNTGTSPITGWTVGATLPAGQTIQQVYNGSFTQSGQRATITNASYNGTIAPGASAGTGMSISWTTNNGPATNLTLNGVPDGGPTGTTTTTTTSRPTTTTTTTTTTTRPTTTTTTTTQPTTTSSSAGGGSCTAAATVSAWTGGFTASVAVSAATALNGWTVSVALPSGTRISNAWNATVTGTTGTVTATPAGWNTSVGPGNPASFGFQADGSADGLAVSCTGPAGPTSSTTTTNSTTTTTTTTTTTQPTTTTTTTTTSTSSGGGALAQAHTAGRVQDAGDGAVQFTWPGVYFEGRFRGTGVGVVLDDSFNDYVVQVDGTTVATLVQPGRTTYWVNNLSNTEHTVRVAKRTEGPWAPGRFGGFVAAAGGSILSKPAARTRQIEFIGDSFTAGYGNQSTSRDCNGTGGVDRNSNADQTFGALTARALNADYQLNAWSGRGMVRNYAGTGSDVDYRTHYDQTLQAYYQSVPYSDSSWKPQVVVVGLGINDFSTALGSGEKWSSQAALVADYKSAYQGFLTKLRAKYGSGTVIVVSATSYGGAIFPATAQQVVQDRNAQGDAKVVFWDYSGAPLDFTGCDWHPSAKDHVALAGILTGFLNALPLNW